MTGNQAVIFQDYADKKPLSAGLPCFGWEHGGKIEWYDTKTVKDGEKMI